MLQGPLGLRLSVDVVTAEQSREIRAWGSCHDSHSLVLLDSRGGKGLDYLSDPFKTYFFGCGDQ